MDKQPLEILLTDMKQRLARGGLEYREAVMLDDMITTIEESLARARKLYSAERPIDGYQREDDAG